MREKVEAFLIEYGECFRRMRYDAKLSEKQVARMLGISQAIISHIETGKMLPPIELEDDLYRIYDVIGKYKEVTGK